MPGPILYSANPWFASHVSSQYRAGVHFAWVCECYDAMGAPPGSAAAMIAPSSSPRRIYETLRDACAREEGHSDLIRGYRRKFKSLAKEWWTRGEITDEQRDEITSSVRTPSWLMWRPVLYVIPRDPIERAGRLHHVPRRDRAAFGAELQIRDLMPNEFDILELH